MESEATVAVPPPETAGKVSAVENTAAEKAPEPVTLKMPIGVRSVALSVLAALGMIFRNSSRACRLAAQQKQLRMFVLDLDL